MRRFGIVLIAVLAANLTCTDARSQDAKKVSRIGWVAAAGATTVKPSLDALRAGLAERGWIEGRNYILLQRYADGALGKVPGLAAELLAERVDVIVTQGPALHGVRAAVKDVPVVYGFSGDPVVAGYADTLAQPLGNLTGVTHMSIELNGKRLDTLREIMPNLERIVILANPTHPGDHLELSDSQDAARRLSIRLQYWPVRDGAELDAAFAGMAADPPQAIVAFPDAMIMQLRQRIIDFGLERRIPAVSGWADFARSGGLFTYGPRLSESYRRLAYYVDRILRGAKPSDLPIERPTTIELVLNLKTAATIGIDVPPSLLARADEVIE
jgi:putative ABC transport system substrate-binding protein